MLPPTLSTDGIPSATDLDNKDQNVPWKYFMVLRRSGIGCWIHSLRVPPVTGRGADEGCVEARQTTEFVSPDRFVLETQGPWRIPLQQPCEIYNISQ